MAFCVTNHFVFMVFLYIFFSVFVFFVFVHKAKAGPDANLLNRGKHFYNKYIPIFGRRKEPNNLDQVCNKFKIFYISQQFYFSLSK